MPQATRPRRVPLLWILLPFALGVALARFLPLPHPLLLVSASAAGLALSYPLAKRGSTSWHYLFASSIVLLGAARFASEQKPEKLLSEIPREAELELRFEALFNATDSDTSLGIATVIDYPIQQKELGGAQIFFFLESQRLAHYPTEGESYRTIGVIRPLKPYSTGDRFDAYLRNQGITHAYKQGYILERSSAASGLSALTNKIRERFSAALSKNKIPESPLTGAYKGLMLGQKSELTPEQKHLFLSNGTMHLFAISGLHIGVIAVCFHQLLSLLRLKGGARAIVTLLAVAAFVLITGGSASSWRALLMVACFYLTTFGHKQASPINALGLSALIYLLLSPGQLFQAGFQMSYLTVTAILLLGLPLAKTLNELLPLFPHIPRTAQNRWQKALVVFKCRLLDTTGVSTAAFLVSAMLGIYYFQIFPTYGILINLVALPLASLAIIAGFISLLLSPISSYLPICEIFNNAALVLIKLIHDLLSFTSSLPAASISTQPIPAWIAVSAIVSSTALICISYDRLGRESAKVWQLITIVFSTGWIAILLALHFH